MGTVRAVPRLLHPLAWWMWAVAMAVVANRTRNPLILVILVAAVVLVAELRGEDRDRRMTLFLWLAAVVVGIRVVAQIVFGGGAIGTTVLFRMPQVPLPEWTGAVRLGGPVTLEELADALYGGMSVAAMIVCLGAATVLASPRRLLRYVPATLYEVGTTLVVGLTYAPMLMDDARTAWAARRLRGRDGRGPREVARVAAPVLSAGLRRSMALAASMESRGYGRPGAGRQGTRRVAGAMVLTGMVGVALGVFGLMSAGTSRPVAAGCLLVGAALATATVWRPGGRRPPGRTVYRPDRWSSAEWSVLICAGVSVAAVFVVVAADPGALTPSTVPLSVPDLPWPAALGVGVAAMVAWTTPVPPDRMEHRP
ncbi:energy-coupling factor transporter transmembrane protein EcfT [Phytoactinopolyspora alkaliphila]|uniref:Energy-coupling factor transporter transmembrane protein EcfT n=1 Tax=Phytoactinopolyspora alkaliphila TaxID=1783498 RepID=A0A6N9YKU4_9ACTN|nr:CbiQ family ECF transporter T component [Phytoactinopolyspora alkaliphila]NED95565.1 energy-coupling factor transporter transmembrane protein EcfT [Phytoactinopolyspora alkaliphila]